MGRVGELWLKGRNRGTFAERLRANLQASLSAELAGAQVHLGRGRVFVQLDVEGTAERALAICADTPGLVDVRPVVRCAPVASEIEATAVVMVREAWAGATGSFAVRAKRTQKTLPFTSPALAAQVGAAVGTETGLAVDLSGPDRVLDIEVDPRRAHLWTAVTPGAGGLPVGTAGTVLLMLSGGIDSPVAGYLAQKRGCALEAVYFHSPPFVGEATREKVEALARMLAPRQAGLWLHVVPFTAVQTEIRARCDLRQAVVLYRRFMYRIAARLAADRGLDALCTGEMLGQVASQTLRNLELVDRVVDRLVLRPLMTWDKGEVTDRARQIGTYETSILPHDDCCTLFVPDDPVTRGSRGVIEAQESRLDIGGMVDAALAGVVSIRV